MILSRIWQRGAAALALLMACSLAAAQPVGYDFNNDGSSDYPVSIISYDENNPDVGAARIWSGASKTIIHTIVSTDTNTLFGWSTGSAGDLDDDGKDDLIVGEPLWSAAADHEGRVQIFSGDDASVLLSIAGPYADTGLGRYVIGVGDWDGDGTPDIAASGWDIADTDSDGIGDDPIGIVFVFSGADGSVLTEITDPTATPGFGYSIFGLGDITGDGLADIAIVDRGAEPYAGIFGQLYIFAGSATATSLDLLDAHRTISNDDSSIRGFAAQVDVMHPDLWLSEPTLQIISLTSPGTGGVNQASIAIDIMEADGTAAGNKGTRSSLVLAGDINLDGKVDALDIQDSISQLGTNPQAIGIMPIADSNNDNIIDATDIQAVINAYGTATDVYEGLWDGTRLLSVAAGSSGFGNLSGISIGPGGTQFGPGPRPKDDCPPVIIAPPDSLTTLVLALLRGDATDNCHDCPEYEEGSSCYPCESDKGISGGSVTASPAQPLATETETETVTFTVAGVSETPGTLKCDESCGDEGTTVPTPLGDPSYVWQVLTKDENGWPEESDPNDGHVGWPAGESIEVGGGTCVEKKAICWAKPSGPCVPDPAWTRVGEKAVKWAPFYLEARASRAAADGTVVRTDLGVCENGIVRAFGEGEPPVPVSVVWEVTNDGVAEPGVPGTLIFVDALDHTSTIQVKATINGCSREIVFNVVEPQAIRYIQSGRLHVVNPSANGGVCGYIELLPTSVSFEGIQFVETSAGATANGSFEWQTGNSHCPGGDSDEDGYCDGVFDVGSNNITVTPDKAFSGSPAAGGPLGPGSLAWNMSGAFRCDPSSAWKNFIAIRQEHIIDQSGTVVTLKRSGGSFMFSIVPTNSPPYNCN